MTLTVLGQPQIEKKNNKITYSEIQQNTGVIILKIGKFIIIIVIKSEQDKVRKG